MNPVSQMSPDPSELSRAKLERLRRLVRLMDREFAVPGTRIRFGLDPLLGLIPIGGDLAGWFVSIFVVWRAAQLGVSRSVMGRMFRISAADVVFGYIPFLGDLADLGFRANSRNLALIEAALRESTLAHSEPMTKKPGTVNAIALVAFSFLTLLLVVAPWLLAVFFWESCG